MTPAQAMGLAIESFQAAFPAQASKADLQATAKVFSIAVKRLQPTGEDLLRAAELIIERSKFMPAPTEFRQAVIKAQAERGAGPKARLAFRIVDGKSAGLIALHTPPGQDPEWREIQPERPAKVLGSRETRRTGETSLSAGLGRQIEAFREDLHRG